MQAEWPSQELASFRPRADTRRFREFRVWFCKFQIIKIRVLSSVQEYSHAIYINHVIVSCLVYKLLITNIVMSCIIDKLITNGAYYVTHYVYMCLQNLLI